MPRTRLFSWCRRPFNQALAAERSSEAPTITRRTFLKLSAGVMATLALPSVSFALPKAKIPKTPVVIVGGGTAGLVTAYRLMKAGVPCEVYEASSRFGGRMFTHEGFNTDGMFCELGGELVDTVHEELISLCEELGLPLEAFADEETNLSGPVYYFEGRAYTQAEVFEAFRPLAKKILADLKKAFPDGEVRMPTYLDTANAQALDDMSLAAYLDQQTEVSPWLRNMLKVAYTGEYGLEADEQSALNLLLLIGTDDEEFALYGDSDEAMRIKGGNGKLPQALVEKLRGQVPLKTGYQLKGICQLPSGALELDFDHCNQPWLVQADRVVLAMPFTVLREIPTVMNLPLSEVKKRCIAELGYGTNTKQMMGFSSRFWREAPHTVTGEVLTDLPAQAFWETSRLQPGKSGIITNFLGGKAGKEATLKQWEQAMPDLDRVYGREVRALHDGNAICFNWSRNPLALGSYSCPRPGQYTRIIGSAHLPELEGRLFFAGEHCSQIWPGYMNGAVDSGNVAASQILDTLAKAPQAALVGSA